MLVSLETHMLTRVKAEVIWPWNAFLPRGSLACSLIKHWKLDEVQIFVISAITNSCSLFSI